MNSIASTHMPHVSEALPDVLMRIVSELYDVAYLIERIEPQLGKVDGDVMLGVADRLMVLQGIDLAVQKTRGLAEFIDTITGTIPEDCLVDLTTALSLVKLADMKRSLASNGVRHGHSQPLTDAAGDFEAF
ncbi:chemotaxis protein CheT [Ensifer soli]|uniref:chemotaxis protein CheT n=1 Tax=Ciceribacter sp. sgz301302 TaxID=3342379 RepID=UPI0035B7CF69